MNWYHTMGCFKLSEEDEGGYMISLMTFAESQEDSIRCCSVIVECVKKGIVLKDE